MDCIYSDPEQNSTYQACDGSTRALTAEPHFAAHSTGKGHPMDNVQQTQPERERKWARIVAKAWADENFKKALMEDPAAVLAEEGLEAPANICLQVVENTDQRIHLVLPAPPKEGEALMESEQRLAAMSWWTIKLCW